MMRLPTFIICGVQKGGTTSLRAYLKAHSSVYIPDSPNELHYFDIEDNFKKGVEWYAHHFVPAREDQTAVGQNSPLYIYEPKVVSRIASLLPEAKLIFILRDPVKRAYSHYWHAVKKGFESLTFEEALEQETIRITESFEHRRRFSYTDRGWYAQQLERYLEHFPREQLLVLLTEDMARGPAETIDKCCDFLGIERQGAQIMDLMPKTRWNASRLPYSPRLQQFTALFRFQSRPLRRLGGLIDQFNLKEEAPPAMNLETQERLQTMFKEEKVHLANLFDLDLSAWSI